MLYLEIMSHKFQILFQSFFKKKKSSNYHFFTPATAINFNFTIKLNSKCYFLMQMCVKKKPELACLQ